MALAWVLREGGITTALIGASKPSQVEDCAARSTISTSPPTSSPRSTATPTRRTSTSGRVRPAHEAGRGRHSPRRAAACSVLAEGRIHATSGHRPPSRRAGACSRCRAQTLPARAFYLGVGGGYADADFGRRTSSRWEPRRSTRTASWSPRGRPRDRRASPCPTPPASRPCCRPATSGRRRWRLGLGGEGLLRLPRPVGLAPPRADAPGRRVHRGGDRGDNPFTGNAVARSYETSVSHQFALMPFAGKTFDRGFFFLGAGPTSRG